MRPHPPLHGPKVIGTIRRRPLAASGVSVLAEAQVHLVQLLETRPTFLTSALLEEFWVQRLPTTKSRTKLRQLFTLPWCSKTAVLYNKTKILQGQER